MSVFMNPAGKYYSAEVARGVSDQLVASPDPVFTASVEHIIKDTGVDAVDYESARSLMSLAKEYLPR